MVTETDKLRQIGPRGRGVKIQKLVGELQNIAPDEIPTPTRRNPTAVGIYEPYGGNTVLSIRKGVFGGLKVNGLSETPPSIPWDLGYLSNNGVDTVLTLERAVEAGRQGKLRVQQI